MISQNTKYSYYGDRKSQTYEKYRLDWPDILHILNTKIIKSITGFSDCIVIETRASFLVGTDGRPISETHTYLCSYNHKMVAGLFGISTGLDDIINTHLGRKCETPDQASIAFMAKLLGARNDNV